MTQQEIFDLVCSSLIKQGVRSADENGNCHYRTKDGLKCAAGFLIPDEDYTSEMEGKSVQALKYFDERHSEEERNLLQSLQSAHDNEGPYLAHHATCWDRDWNPNPRPDLWLSDFKRRATLVAEHFGLEVPADGR